MVEDEHDVPVAPQPVLSVVEYSTPAPRNRSAKHAIIFAVLGFIPFVPGFLAFRSGRRALREANADPQIGGQGTARTAIALGIASIVVWTIIAILAVPVALHARRQSQVVHCMSNLRQMGMAAQIYAVQNSGLLPPHIDVLTTVGIPATLFQCPACAGDPTKPIASTGVFGSYHYVYLGNGRSMNKIRNVSAEPLVYEPLTNHADPGINVLYVDGHVERLEGATANAFLQKVAAATQPTTAPIALEP